MIIIATIEHPDAMNAWGGASPNVEKIVEIEEGEQGTRQHYRGYNYSSHYVAIGDIISIYTYGGVTSWIFCSIDRANLYKTKGE